MCVCVFVCVFVCVSVIKKNEIIFFVFFHKIENSRKNAKKQNISFRNVVRNFKFDYVLLFYTKIKHEIQINRVIGSKSIMICYIRCSFFNFSNEHTMNQNWNTLNFIVKKQEKQPNSFGQKRRSKIIILLLYYIILYIYINYILNNIIIYIGNYYFFQIDWKKCTPQCFVWHLQHT